MCKKKFKPFTVNIETTTTVSGATKTSIKVERMFGCAHHHAARKKVVAVHGERKGWHPFGVWSQRKAETRAKEVWEEEEKKKKRKGEHEGKHEGKNGGTEDKAKDTAKATHKRKSHHKKKVEPISIYADDDDTCGGTGTGNKKGSSNPPPSAPPTTTTSKTDSNFDRMVCLGGACAWKIRGRHDDVKEELGETGGVSGAIPVSNRGGGEGRGKGVRK